MPTTRQIRPKVAVAGWGALGKIVVQALIEDPRYQLVAVGSQQSDALTLYLQGQQSDARVCRSDQLASLADVVIECLAPAAFVALAESLVDSGKTVIVLSAATLLKQQALLANAEAGGVKVVVATGAIMGLDAVRAMRRDGITDCLIVNRKRPAGLAGAPYVTAHAIDLAAITQPTLIFKGTAHEAALGFPQNVNVAVALSLAACGTRATRCEIWADPLVAGNMHSITVKSKSAELLMTTVGVPDVASPKSSVLAAHSALAALDSLFSPLRIGS